MLVRSEEKLCHAWILTDIRRAKNIQTNIKFGWRIRIQHRPDKKILRKRNVY